jgi:hypothetical protein
LVYPCEAGFVGDDRGLDAVVQGEAEQDRADVGFDSAYLAIRHHDP